MFSLKLPFFISPGPLSCFSYLYSDIMRVLGLGLNLSLGGIYTHLINWSGESYLKNRTTFTFLLDNCTVLQWRWSSSFARLYIKGWKLTMNGDLCTQNPLIFISPESTKNRKKKLIACHWYLLTCWLPPLIKDAFMMVGPGNYRSFMLEGAW